MKIASLETEIVLLPNDEPLGGFSENPNAKNPIVTLRLRSDDGIEGLGVCYFGGALTRTLRHAVDELGALTIGEDPVRVEAIAKKLRDAAGQSGPAGILTLAMSAIDIGRRVEDAGVGLFWLEDVTAHDDYAGLARVTAALATPVAGGEYLYGITPFRHMVEARSVDIVMIDQVRSGGITPWLKIAGMAEAFNLPVVSHGVPEIHVHLVGAVPNGLTVEYMPRLFPLWKAVPQPVDGMLAMPIVPGLGLEFDQAAIEKYRA